MSNEKQNRLVIGVVLGGVLAWLWLRRRSSSGVLPFDITTPGKLDPPIVNLGGGCCDPCAVPTAGNNNTVGYGNYSQSSLIQTAIVSPLPLVSPGLPPAGLVVSRVPVFFRGRTVPIAQEVL